MAGIEVSSTNVVCYRCGKTYGKLAGYFYKSYGGLYKGRQYLPYCRDCVDSMFAVYYDESRDKCRSMRQICRKLDLYWNDKLFESIDNQTTNNTIVSTYIQKLNQTKYAGKSYDDTLREEGALWVWPTDYRDLAYAQRRAVEVEADAKIKEAEARAEDAEARAVEAEAKAMEAALHAAKMEEAKTEEVVEEDPVPDDVISFWGAGYTNYMYRELEQRKRYYMSSFPEGSDNDVGLLSLIRQICALELDINRDRAAGKDVSKSVTTHNTLLGAAGLKPIQKDDGSDAAFEKTPFGVWIERWENKRPIPDPDPELKDVDGIVRYITVWFLGHLCKMLGIRNSYCKLYEEEIARMRVEHPEFEEDDDETLFNDIFTTSPGGDDS